MLTYLFIHLSTIHHPSIHLSIHLSVHSADIWVTPFLGTVLGGGCKTWNQSKTNVVPTLTVLTRQWKTETHVHRIRCLYSLDLFGPTYLPGLGPSLKGKPGRLGPSLKGKPVFAAMPHPNNPWLLQPPLDEGCFGIHHACCDFRTQV